MIYALGYASPMSELVWTSKYACFIVYVFGHSHYIYIYTYLATQTWGLYIRVTVVCVCTCIHDYSEYVPFSGGYPDFDGNMLLFKHSW